MTTQHSASLCPTCGRRETHADTKTIAGITTSTYLCQRRHLWVVKWGQEVAA